MFNKNIAKEKTMSQKNYTVNSRKNKHLTERERYRIETLLIEIIVFSFEKESYKSYKSTLSDIWLIYFILFVQNELLTK